MIVSAGRFPQKSLRRIADVRPSGVDKLSIESEMPVKLCNYVDVYKNDRITAALSFMTATATLAEIERFTLESGDVLITKDSETPNDIAAAAIVDPSAVGNVCGYHLALLRPDPRQVTGEFLFWTLKAADTLTQFSVRAQGITRFGLTTGAIRDVTIPVPALSEQSAIAAFLDRETSKIDALVAEQERLIALLKEKRQAVISHAVTKGLNPNAPMKDSGVPWLGKVPTNWTVTRVKACSLLITSGPRGWSERISDNGVLFIQSGDLDDDLRVQTNRAKQVNVRPDAEALRSRLQDGDVVVCITGAKTGNVGLFHGGGAEAYINQHLSLIRPNHRIRSRFLGYVLKGNPGQLHFYTSQYGLKQGLSLEDVGLAPVALPSVSEQNQIVVLVDDQIARLDVLETEATRAITLLRERRAALISAAVTGKIDVRDTVAQPSLQAA